MKSKKELQKVILMTGGSRGLGAVLVRQLLETTPHVVVTFSRKETPLMKKLVRSFPSRFVFKTINLNHREEVRDCVMKFAKDADRHYRTHIFL